MDGKPQRGAVNLKLDCLGNSYNKYILIEPGSEPEQFLTNSSPAAVNNINNMKYIVTIWMIYYCSFSETKPSAFACI